MSKALGDLGWLPGWLQKRDRLLTGYRLGHEAGSIFSNEAGADLFGEREGSKNPFSI